MNVRLCLFAQTAKHSTRGLAVAVVLVLGFGALTTVAGCTKTNPDTPAAVSIGTPTSPRTPPPAPTGDAHWRKCTVDRDCVPVELGCCDTCNGGEAQAFHKDHAASAKATLGRKNCEKVPCTEIGCPPLSATCVDHVCQVKKGTF